jgi:predicted DNA-binding protein
MAKTFGPIPEDKPKDRVVVFRMPKENFDKLQELNPNVSHTLRYIVEVYLHELANREERFTEWNRKT